VALVALDASVVIAFLSPKDAHHEAAVSALREHEDDELVLPAVAYAEVLVGPYARGSDAVEVVRGFVADMRISIEPVSDAIAERAAELRAQAKIRMPDALVLATGDVLDADTILTADDRWPKVHDRATLI
jgi:predicted nucleic acid-binding protein